MKRSEFFNYINSFKNDQIFGMIYKKKNGEIRNAKCCIHPKNICEFITGTGINRYEKMDKLQIFQYFDINSNAYRSARLENIMEVIINEEVIKLED